MLPFAVRTGLEPATPGVTGRYSNQLNYRTIVQTLCVFVERGCKGTHFFYISKFFLNFLQKNIKKMAVTGITLVTAGCSESENSIFRKSGNPLFYFNHAFLLFYFCFLKLWNVDVQDSVLDGSLNRILVNVFGEYQGLMDFCV